MTSPPPPDPLSPDGWDSPAPKEPPPAPPTLWTRFLAWIRAWFTDRGDTWPDGDHEPYAPPTSVTPDHVPRDEITLETPALGDAFNFRVTILIKWEVRATGAEPAREADPKELEAFIAASRRGIREVIEDRVRPVARRYPPYRAAEAEEHLGRELKSCFHDGDLQATVRVRVDVTEQVQQKLREVWLKRLLVDANGDLRKGAVTLTGELQDMWHEVLRKGLTEFGPVDAGRTAWIAPYALALTENPKNAAGYLTTLLEKRVNHAQMLLNELSDIVTDRDHVDALEIAFQSQSALRAVLLELGVPAGDPRLDGGNADRENGHG